LINVYLIILEGILSNFGRNWKFQGMDKAYFLKNCELEHYKDNEKGTNQRNLAQSI